MKIFNKVLVIKLVFVFICSFMGLGFVSAATSPTLTDATNYSVLGFTTITNTGATTLTGNLGLYSGTSITGFLGTVENDGPGTVGGTVHQTDGPGAGTAQDAQTDNVAAFSTLDQGCNFSYADGQDLTLLSPLGPGVYCSAGSFALSGDLTLTGSGVWIFKSASTLITASGSSITGGDPCNVWWRVGSSATLGTTTDFIGNILALASITMNNGATLDGRVMAQTGAVTLNNNTITGPTCSAPTTTAQLTLEKEVTNDNGGLLDVTDFPLTATGPDVITGVSGLAGVTNKTVDPGVYTLSETTQTDYSSGLWSCTNGITVNGSSQITLIAGDSTVCTITNNDMPQLIVNKVIVGGSKGTADFSYFVNGVGVAHGVINEFLAGLNTVSETPDSSYTTVISGDCLANGTVTLSENELFKTCTITNTYITPSSGGSSGSYVLIPPLIDVIKIPSPLALPLGPGLVTYTYTLKNIGTVPVNNITMIDDSCSTVALISGDVDSDAKLDIDETWIYRCSSTLTKTTTNIVTTTGWANGVSATDVASATVVVGASIVPPLIHITKIPSPLALIGGGAVIYKYTVTNPGTVPLSNVYVTDDKCTGLPGRVLGHPGDLNKNNLLESNESWSFICKSNLTKTTTNTATASGSANGLTAKDVALATVVVSIPGFPKTGFFIGNSFIQILSIIGGLFVILISLYILKKKQII
jgi:type VI secretion system secreted protein VgrG